MSPFPRPDYEALRRYDPERAPVRLDLSDNTNLWGTHPAALERVRTATADDLARYPTLYADPLRRAVADRIEVHGFALIRGNDSQGPLSTLPQIAAITGGSYHRIASANQLATLLCQTPLTQVTEVRVRNRQIGNSEVVAMVGPDGFFAVETADALEQLASHAQRAAHQSTCQRRLESLGVAERLVLDQLQRTVVEQHLAVDLLHALERGDESLVHLVARGAQARGGHAGDEVLRDRDRGGLRAGVQPHEPVERREVLRQERFERGDLRLGERLEPGIGQFDPDRAGIDVAYRAPGPGPRMPGAQGLGHQRLRPARLVDQPMCRNLGRRVAQPGARLGQQRLALAQRLARRFQQVENLVEAQGKEMTGMSLRELDALWDEAKKAVSEEIR